MNNLKNFIKNKFRRVGNILTEDIRNEIVTSKNILIDWYIKENLFKDSKYSNLKKLTKFEYQVYSQNGEDGIVDELFKRVGHTNKYFVEFGVEEGLECNTLFLLLQDWKGCWLDGSDQCIRAIEDKFDFLIKDKKLSLKKAFITAENIEILFNSLGVPKEFDLLSIDIDGNDYWVWNAIKNYSPRVVIIEYNAIFRPPVEFIVKYEPNKIYPITSYFGASLKSMEILGFKKGYKLVGCDFVGANAFFVREDLVKDNFLEPFTAEVHYEPPKYFLTRKIGHKRDFGKFENNTNVQKY